MGREQQFRLRTFSSQCICDTNVVMSVRWSLGLRRTVGYGDIFLCVTNEEKENQRVQDLAQCHQEGWCLNSELRDFRNEVAELVPILPPHSHVTVGMLLHLGCKVEIITASTSWSCCEG